MSILPTVYLPNGRALGTNAALTEISRRLLNESHALRTLSEEVLQRDSLSTADVSALTARLTGTAAQITMIETEVGAAASLTAVAQATGAMWTGSAARISGGLDRMGQ